MNELFRQETPCARKEHLCDLCGETIYKGKRYVHLVQTSDGIFFNSHYHEDCYDLIERYCRTRDMDDPYEDAMVLDDIRERVCDDCDVRPKCQFGYRRTPLCPRVNSKYLMEKKAWE